MMSWKILASRPLLNRQPWLDVWEEDIALPNGHIIHGYLRAVARDFAEIFAVIEDGTIPLVHQYKHGIDKMSYGLPAGYLDTPAEEPLAAAKRELLEETGLEAQNWEPLGSYVVDTNRGATRAHLFLARNAYQVGPQHLDLTEDIEVSYHTPDQLRSMVLLGEIDSLATAGAIFLALDRLNPCGFDHESDS